MVNCEGYKYVIRWDFDLNGKTILVPENCILEFDGGTLSNGTIIGQDTYINDVGGLGVETLFGEGITREGTWRINEGGGVKPGDLANYYTKSELDSGEGRRPTTAEVERMISDIPKDVDDHLDATSVNPLQNKVVTNELKLKANSDNIFTKDYTDAVPTAYSQKIVNSGAVYNAIQSASATLNNSISQKADSDNVYSKQAVDKAIAEKADKGTTIEDYGIGDAFTKTETNAAIALSVENETARATAAEQELIELYTAVTQSNMIVMEKSVWDAKDWSTESGIANTIYRVSGTNSYADYMFKSTDLHTPVKMAEYNNAIDTEPIDNSSNVVQSGGVKKFVDKRIQQINSKTIRFAFTDSEDNVAAYCDSSNNMHVDGVVTNSVDTKEINTEDFKTKSVEVDGKINNCLGINHTKSDVYSVLVLDKNDNVISITDKDGNKREGNDLKQSKAKSNIYNRNLDKVAYAVADAAYMEIYDGSYVGPWGTDRRINKRLQLLVVTDTHELTECFQNAVDFATDLKSIDAIIHLGDFTFEVDPASDLYSKNKPVIESTIRPLYMTAGNHDVGSYSTYVKYCKDDEDIYNRFIKPSVEKGYLLNGEYQEGRCYYYHDFPKYKVRLIMLYPFDNESELDDTYWEAIDFDSTYPSIAVRTGNNVYKAGDKINVPGHTKNSFMAKQNVEVTHISSTKGYAWTNGVDYGYDKVPHYRAVRAYTWFKQQQLDWFVNTIKEAQTLGYSVIIGQHYPCIYGWGTNPSQVTDAEGYQLNNTRFDNPFRGNDVSSEVRYTTENKNIIAQIVNKYVNGGSISKTIYPYGKTNPLERTSNAVYYGVDDARDLASVVVNYSFAGGGRAFFINGHTHSDNIVKSDKYDLLQIGFLCGTRKANFACDTVIPISDPRYADTMTALTVEDGKIHLTRIGISTTVRIGDNNKLIDKSNEIINY